MGRFMRATERRSALGSGIVAVAKVSLIVGIMSALAFGYLMTRPTPSYVAPAMPPAHDVTLTAQDGVRLAASYWPGRVETAPGILLLHGVGGSRVIGNAEWLAARGYAVLAIDFRGHGQSDSAIKSFGLYEARDARVAFDWLKQKQSGAPVAVIGISLGGAAALLGEDGPLPAQALVLHAVFPDIRRAIYNRMVVLATERLAWLIEPALSFQSFLWFGVAPSAIAPVAALKKFDRPVMIVGSEADAFTTLQDTRDMFAAAPGPKTLWLVRDLPHGIISDIATDAYRQALAAFLTLSIGDAPTEQ